MASTKEFLERARIALTAEDFAAARDALIAAWRNRRVPAIAALVDIVADRAPDALTAKLAEVVTPRVHSTHENVKALRGIDDPRLSGFAIDALVRLPFTASTARLLLRELFEIVEELRDGRLVDRAEAIATGIATRINRLEIRKSLHKQLRAVVAAIKVPVMTAEEAAIEQALVKLLEPLRKPTRSAEALLADIYANPDDDAPRLVLADLLLERGDPRGELIMLQLERGEAEPSKREQELLKKHGKTWLGNLAPVLSWGRGYSNTRFRRGFVAVADIILSVGKKLQPLRTDPAWATVEELQGSWDAELLLAAPLRALRVIERQLDAAEIAKLARRSVPLASVRQIWIANPTAIDPSALRAAFPGLETVSMYRYAEGSSNLAALGNLGITRVAITNNWVSGDVTDAVNAFTSYVDGLVGTPAPMARLSLSTPRGSTVELQRDAHGMFERL